MSSNKIIFYSGDIEISSDNISFKSFSKKLRSQTMRRNQLNGINYEEFTYLKYDPFTYALRYLIVFLPLGFTFLVLFGIYDKNIFNIAFFICMLIAFIFVSAGLIDSTVDALFGTRIGKNICSFFLGKKTYKISLQNNSGGDHIEFYVNPNELVKAKNLIQFKIVNEEINTSKISSLKELNDLAELKRQGVINDSEFNMLKKQILK